MGYLEEHAWIGEHIALYRKDPAKAHDWQSFSGGIKPTLLLTTKGRKTGNQIDSPLVYGKQGSSFVIVGSKGGDPEHPSWYKNLLANPDAEIQVALDHYLVSARTATGDERDTLFAIMVEILPHYATMGKAAAGSREIPVVVLDPR
ncbi:nitroreductase family deazaflavin-dependent oxidoreductase [Sphingomonas sp. TX0543]|uniref:nitroreductase family deazaflavin-dependent oxidoreductase n=1 Tax=Sphingomonas sp. TX0543 TaxID=3399682 RepID=UPI003AFAEB06